MKSAIFVWQCFTAWAFWFIADRVELPFIVRFAAFGAFILAALMAVAVWVRKRP